ncbi:hypothetical protein [Nocardioides mangrovicus]|uniref:hypothetical protein n=1 Tax=Nocardioides mangrovicus TaxID=2478913 RepID=UPI0011C3B51C|nr:hypothetical protein [Nocardioides mangrovicus]
MSGLGLALRLLPVEVRARYREETEADLADLRGHRRARYVIGFWLTVPALRHALRRPQIGLDGHRIRLRCRLGLHHWHTYRTADNAPYRRCDRCGHDDDLGHPVAGEGSMAAAMSVYQATQ